ncbi:MAG: class I SAM-dependent methyltransferase [Lysobacterales bacterium]
MVATDHRGFYTSEAASYEATRYGSRYGRLFRILQRAAVAQSVGQAQRILDVATGTGQMLPVLAHAAGLVVASDLTPAMLSEARLTFPDRDGIAYSVGDASRLPFFDGSFDVVASSRFLHLFEPAMQAILINEMARVLKPGGTLIVDFYSHDGRSAFKVPVALYRTLLRKRPENDFRVSITDAQAMVKASGLDVTNIRGLGNFLLLPLAWLPMSWLVRSAARLGSRWPRMSEQFLLTARKP